MLYPIYPSTPIGWAVLGLVWFVGAAVFHWRGGQLLSFARWLTGLKLEADEVDLCFIALLWPAYLVALLVTLVVFAGLGLATVVFSMLFSLEDATD